MNCIIFFSHDGSLFGSDPYNNSGLFFHTDSIRIGFFIVCSAAFFEILFDCEFIQFHSLAIYFSVTFYTEWDEPTTWMCNVYLKACCSTDGVESFWLYIVTMQQKRRKQKKTRSRHKELTATCWAGSLHTVHGIGIDIMFRYNSCQFIEGSPSINYRLGRCSIENLLNFDTNYVNLNFDIERHKNRTNWRKIIILLQRRI